MSTRNQSGAINRKLLIWLAIPLILVGFLFGGWSALRYKSERVRADWKTAALARLAGVSLTDGDIRQELQTLKASRGTGEHQEWVGDRALLMTNGEYVIYEYRHGRNDYYPPHLFLGRCSDGEWPYSSYHFCKMNMVRSDDPPGSIAEFAKRYSARAFDGKSDECLKMTK